nr:immunoglobulin light chain junction region [Macaca mulatta]
CQVWGSSSDQVLF